MLIISWLYTRAWRFYTRTVLSHMHVTLAQPSVSTLVYQFNTLVACIYSLNKKTASCKVTWRACEKALYVCRIFKLLYIINLLWACLQCFLTTCTSRYHKSGGMLGWIFKTTIKNYPFHAGWFDATAKLCLWFLIWMVSYFVLLHVCTCQVS